MGRPRKPAAVKALQGTLRPGREKSAAPSAAPGMPALPDGWAEAAPWRARAVEEYRELGPRLVELGILTPVDRSAFLAYCDAVGRVDHWTKDIAEHGATQTTESGYEAQRPAVAFLNRASADLKKFLTLFGLSPSDRSKVSRTPGEPEDPARKFFDGPRLAP